MKMLELLNTNMTSLIEKKEKLEEILAEMKDLELNARWYVSTASENGKKLFKNDLEREVNKDRMLSSMVSYQELLSESKKYFKDISLLERDITILKYRLDFKLKGD